MISALIVILFGIGICLVFYRWTKRNGYIEAYQINSEYDALNRMIDAWLQRELSMKTIHEHSDECRRIQEIFDGLVGRGTALLNVISFKGLLGKVSIRVMENLNDRGHEVSDRIMEGLDKRMKFLDEEGQRLIQQRHQIDEFYSKKTGA